MTGKQNLPLRIFERWLERFGHVDQEDEIYVAIVRSISAENPAHYRVLITARLPPEDELTDGRLFTIASRIQTMQAESDANLAHFLRMYSQASAYLLVPAIWKGKGEPEFLLDLSIRKRKLSVRAASEIDEHDVEAIALGPGRRSPKAQPT